MPGEVELMVRAVRLAERGRGHVRPNPPVGAVIVADGEIIGEGWHHRAGAAHAETASIANARRRGFGSRLAGAELFVTLEPCSRPGRVGACTDAIAAAGIRRVVYGLGDPNPVNRGRARRVLARAGIVCERLRGADEALAAELTALIRPFAKHIATGLPYVTVKLAMSLDGRIADDNGEARWVSSAAARRATGKLREVVDAIMVGAETVRRDNPSLLAHGRRNDDLLRVVVSKSGQLPSSAQVFTDGRNPTLVFADPATALRELGARGVCWVLCEGGLELARSLAAAGLVDEWLTVLAPTVIGHRPIGGKLPYAFSEIQPLGGGSEVMITCLPALSSASAR